MCWLKDGRDGPAERGLLRGGRAAAGPAAGESRRARAFKAQQIQARANRRAGKSGPGRRAGPAPAARQRSGGGRTWSRVTSGLGTGPPSRCNTRRAARAVTARCASGPSVRRGVAGRAARPRGSTPQLPWGQACPCPGTSQAAPAPRPLRPGRVRSARAASVTPGPRPLRPGRLARPPPHTGLLSLLDDGGSDTNAPAAPAAVATAPPLPPPPPPPEPPLCRRSRPSRGPAGPRAPPARYPPARPGHRSTVRIRPAGRSPLAPAPALRAWPLRARC